MGEVEGAEARRGDVRSSWSRGLPPAADVRTVNNPERSVEGGDSRPFPEERPSPAAARPSPSSGPWGAAGTSESERAGGRDLAGCAALLRLPDGGARDGRVARSLARSARSRRGDSRAARSARALGAAWAEPALLVPE